MKESIICFILISLFAWGCNGKEEVSEVIVFDGPLLEADSVQTLYSDSAVVRVQVKAPKQYDYGNGNREFPHGMYVEFFEPDGSVSATLEADKGYYFKESDRYTAVGNVVIDGRKENNRLNTDTLHWSPPTKRIYTKARVMIISEGSDTVRGLGLEAAQDFSTYTILQPEGTTLLKD